LTRAVEMRPDAANYHVNLGKTSQYSEC